jgi:thiamine-phosphate pyrophosphorylase
MLLETARNLLGPEAIIGKTLHSIKDAKKVKNEKIDYVSAGPVFSTPLKKSLRPKGVGFIKKIKRRVSVPLFAIGGMNKENAGDVLKSGADGICVTRAIFQNYGLTKKNSRF